MNNRLLLFVLLIALGAPAVAQANAGTPLMWLTGLHLVFGNFVIGLFEGTILVWLCRAKPGRAIGLMILANYASAWIGYAWLMESIREGLEFDLYNTWSLLGWLTVICFLVTIVLEWPFVAASLGRTPKWFRRSLGASLVVQTLSYAALVGLYWMSSGVSLYTEMTIVPPGEISLPAEIELHYIGEQDGNVYSRLLATQRSEKVFDLHSKALQDCLSFEKEAGEKWRLVALSDSGDRLRPKTISLGRLLPADALPHDERGIIGVEEVWGSPGGGPIPRLGAAQSSPWSFRAGYWPLEGLRGENSQTGAQFGFSLETRFAQWAVRHATHLPGDKLLFQLGERQICVADVATKRVALLAFGRGPVCTLRTDPAGGTVEPLESPHLEAAIAE